MLFTNFLDWAETELRILDGEKLSTESKAALEILKLVKNWDDSTGNLDILKLSNRIYELLRGHVLTAVYDMDEDWQKIDLGNLLPGKIHRRRPSLINDAEIGIVDYERFITCDILEGDTYHYVEATDFELLLIAKMFPIKFPYFPKYNGVLYKMETEHYLAYTYYKDECSGETKVVNRYFEKENDYNEVNFSEASKELLNSFYGMKDYIREDIQGLSETTNKE